MGRGRLGLGPGGGRVHFTGDKEVRMEGKGYGGRVGDVGPLRRKHLLPNGLCLCFSCNLENFVLVPKDVPWRTSNTKLIPKIHHSPFLRITQNATSNYAISVMKHPKPVGSGLAMEAIMEAAGPECIVLGKVAPIKFLGVKVAPIKFLGVKVWPIEVNLKFLEPIGLELKQLGKMKLFGEAMHWNGMTLKISILRREYLKKREQKKLEEIRDDIEDEQYLFDGLKLTEVEYCELSYKKKNIRAGKEEVRWG